MQDQRDAYEADVLARRDHLSVDRWRAELDARIAAGCFEMEGAAK
jgi:hypothetical protein